MTVPDRFDELHLMVGRTEGKVDLLLAQGKMQDDRAIALETRVRIVENRQWWLAGAAAGVGASASHFVKWLTGH